MRNPALDRTLPRRRIGAKRDQDGNLGPGAPQAPARDMSLSPQHDWSAFDSHFHPPAPQGPTPGGAPVAPLASPIVPTGTTRPVPRGTLSLSTGDPFMPSAPTSPFRVPKPLTGPIGNATSDAANLAANKALYAPGGGAAMLRQPAVTRGTPIAGAVPIKGATDGSVDVFTSQDQARRIAAARGDKSGGQIVYRPPDPGQRVATNGVSPASAHNDINGVGATPQMGVAGPTGPAIGKPAAPQVPNGPGALATAANAVGGGLATAAGNVADAFKSRFDMPTLPTSLPSPYEAGVAVGNVPAAVGDVASQAGAAVVDAAQAGVKVAQAGKAAADKASDEFAAGFNGQTMPEYRDQTAHDANMDAFTARSQPRPPMATSLSQPLANAVTPTPRPVPTRPAPPSGLGPNPSGNNFADPFARKMQPRPAPAGQTMPQIDGVLPPVGSMIENQSGGQNPPNDGGAMPKIEGILPPAPKKPDDEEELGA